MLQKKFKTMVGLLRSRGLKEVLRHTWIRLQLMAIAKGYKRTVKLDGCSFSVTGMSEAQAYFLVADLYENAERNAIAQYLKADLPVIELGGSMGIVACVTNKLLRHPTAHVVVEANPHAIPHLQLNKKANRCEFEIVNKAIAYGSESVTFSPSSSICGSSIQQPGDQESVTVGTINLNDLVRDHGFKKFVLVCDIEGLEYELICQEPEVLKLADTIILETHARFIGEDKLSFMMKRLREIGFKLLDETGYVVVLQQQRILT